MEEEAVGEDFGERKERIAAADCLRCNTFGGSYCFVQWYSVQNRKRISEQNKNYAADSARQMAVRINDELKNALNLIDTYTYFLGESLTEPEVSAQLLEEIERNTWFDACLFTDMDGMNHSSDGRSADASTRDYYLNGIKGEKGVTVVFDSKFFDETMISFYAPVYYQEELIGVIRGTYLAEEYLKNMLATTYFGKRQMCICACRTEE